MGHFKDSSMPSGTWGEAQEEAALNRSDYLPDSTSALNVRYILMKDRASRNYLYNYATVVQIVGRIAIVKIEAPNVDYTARYQLNRLHSGWEAIDDVIYTSQDNAACAAAKPGVLS